MADLAPENSSELLLDEDGTSSGQVHQIRRQWALHEDEALAYRLQNEEITQHYSGNRTRNATVREDVPRAKEEQEREEREALAERFLQLSLLRQQAEEDARIAKLLDESENSEVLGAAGGLGLEDDDLDFGILDNEEAVGIGAQAEGFTEVLDLTELKRLQEKRDEKLAWQLQEEIDQLERDKLLAIEQQDREVAKMLYIKEKAKIKRARERAKLKAEAAGLVSPTSDPYSIESLQERSFDNGRPVVLPVSGLSGELKSPFHRHRSDGSKEDVVGIPPKIPEKSHSVDIDDPIRFRAVPKPLPPQPNSSAQSSASASSRKYTKASDEPVPPYMPMHGFNIQNRKK